MELGKVYNCKKFNSSVNTTYLIDALMGWNVFHEEKYDTIKLTWVFSVFIKNKGYPVSLYLKSSPKKYDTVLKTGLTFTSLKRKIANRGLNLEKLKSEWFYKNFVEVFYNNPVCNEDYELDNAIELHAQCSLGRDWGETMTYYIVGFRIEESFDL